MHELSKATQRRLHDPNFINRYFKGDGIDIGAGNDPLGQYLELFGMISSCRAWDKGDGNAETMQGIPDAQFDFVHCVRPGQRVITPFGRIAIEKIRPGDIVLGRRGFVRTKSISRRPFCGRLYRLETSQGVAEVTGNHPIATPAGWFDADHLGHTAKIFVVPSEIEPSQFVDCGNILRAEGSRAPLGSDRRINIVNLNAPQAKGAHDFRLFTLGYQIWRDLLQYLGDAFMSATNDDRVRLLSFGAGNASARRFVVANSDSSTGQNIATMIKEAFVGIDDGNDWLQALSGTNINADAPFAIDDPSQIRPLSIENLLHISSFDYEGDVVNLETTDGTFVVENILTHNSSHCLEDMENPHTALKNWFRILKPGGHLIVVVPDEDMYEQGIFPSTFNPDHHWTFTIHKTRSWNLHSQNILALLIELGEEADIIKIEQLIGTYRFGIARCDQTNTPLGEAAIEFVVRKRPKDEVKAAGCLDEMRMVRAGVQPPDPAMRKIALHRPGAIGDIIMTLNLIPLLKRKYPNYEIHYFCDVSIGQGLKEVMKGAGVNKGIDCRRFADMRYEYEEAFNLIGYPLAEGYPEKPMRQHLLYFFAEEMGLERPPELPHLKLDPGPVPVAGRYATIHPRAGWSPYKNWAFEKWEEVIKRRDDITFFQIGAGTDRKLVGANHIFMGTPLKVSINLMGHSSMHVGVDSWTNHLTNVEWEGRGFVPSVILWGSTQWKAAGYDRNINISLGLECQPCFREDPKISRMDRGPCINPPGQVFEDQKHACLAGVTVEMVLEAIERIWPCGKILTSTAPAA